MGMMEGDMRQNKSTLGIALLAIIGGIVGAILMRGVILKFLKECCFGLSN
jgi:hypothetical protein